MLPQSSGSKDKPLALLATCFLLVSCLAYSPILNTYASETSLEFQWTTSRYIPKDWTLHINRCEDLKSYTLFPDVI
jgi:hypothetical protein